MANKDHPESNIQLSEDKVSNSQQERISTKTVSLDEALEKAIELHQNGRSVEARGIYQAILKVNPAHSGALHFLGILYYQGSGYEEAIELILLALQSDPEYTDARNNLGNIYQDLQKFTEAETTYRAVLTAEPAHTDAINNLAAVLKAQGKVEEALTHYQQAVQLAPDNVTFHYNIGNAYASTTQWQQASDAYSKAIELDPAYAIAYRELGGVQRALGMQNESLETFAKAVELDESHAEAHCLHGNALQTSGLLDDAVAAYQRAIEYDYSLTQIYPNLIVALNSLGRLSEAKVYVNRWKELEPTSAAAIHMHASVTGTDVPTRAPDTYVSTLFDNFSEKFDQKLESLEYQAPQLLLKHALKSGIVSADTPCKIMDAGCGTGLCGPLFRQYASLLNGVDLSSGMLKGAKLRDEYDNLELAELTAHLQSCNTPYDLIISADTLVYFGDLEDVLQSCNHALHNGGWLIFSVEKLAEANPDIPHQLNLNGRYSHSGSYLKDTLSDSSFVNISLTEEILRQELGKPVHGFVVVAQKS